MSLVQRNLLMVKLEDIEDTEAYAGKLRWTDSKWDPIRLPHNKWASVAMLGAVVGWHRLAQAPGSSCVHLFPVLRDITLGAQN